MAHTEGRIFFAVAIMYPFRAPDFCIYQNHHARLLDEKGDIVTYRRYVYGYSSSDVVINFMVRYTLLIDQVLKCCFIKNVGHGRLCPMPKILENTDASKRTMAVFWFFQTVNRLIGTFNITNYLPYRNL